MSKLLIPYSGEVFLTSIYGNRVLNGEQNFHHGVDLVGIDSKIIYSPCDGVVISSTMIPKETDKTSTWEWGNYIHIKTNDGYHIFLCHLKERNVLKGETVKMGQRIGVEGNTGYSFGSHCHFEVRDNLNMPIDPTQFLGIPNKAGAYKNDPDILDIFSVNLDGNTPHSWGRDAVEWAIDRKILRGDSNLKPEYRLHDSITREEAIVFINRAMKLLTD